MIFIIKRINKGQRMKNRKGLIPISHSRESGKAKYTPVTKAANQIPALNIVLISHFIFLS